MHEHLAPSPAHSPPPLRRRQIARQMARPTASSIAEAADPVAPASVQAPSPPGAARAARTAPPAAPPPRQTASITASCNCGPAPMCCSTHSCTSAARYPNSCGQHTRPARAQTHEASAPAPPMPASRKARRRLPAASATARNSSSLRNRDNTPRVPLRPSVTTQPPDLAAHCAARIMRAEVGFWRACRRGSAGQVWACAIPRRPRPCCVGPRRIISAATCAALGCHVARPHARPPAR